MRITISKNRIILAQIFAIVFLLGMLSNPRTGYSGEIDKFNFYILNQTELNKACEKEVAGCTDENGKIWISSNMTVEQFETVCNHEVLHNILYLEPEQEHEVIRKIERNTKFDICRQVTQQQFKVSLKH